MYFHDPNTCTTKECELCELVNKAIKKQGKSDGEYTCQLCKGPDATYFIGGPVTPICPKCSNIIHEYLKARTAQKETWKKVNNAKFPHLWDILNSIEDDGYNDDDKYQFKLMLEGIEAIVVHAHEQARILDSMMKDHVKKRPTPL